MRYILTFLIVVCMSAFCAYKTADADSGKFPHNKGGYNVKGAFTWGEYGIFSGDVYFVSSTHTDASNDPSSGFKRKPFSTLEYAISRTGVTSGDLFVCLPGHIETVTEAGGLDLDVAGISIIGIGSGSSRPTIRFTTVATADVDVDAANITMANFLLEARFPILLQGIDVNAADFKLLKCETRDIVGVGSYTNFLVADANADRMLIDGYRHIGVSTTGTNHPRAAIQLTGGDDIIIRNFNIYGNFDYGGIVATTTSCTRLNIHGGEGWSFIFNENATDTTIEVLASTGNIGPNISSIINDNGSNITEALTGTAIQFIRPLPITNNEGNGEASTQTNITSSTD